MVKRRPFVPAANNRVLNFKNFHVSIFQRRIYFGIVDCIARAKYFVRFQFYPQSSSRKFGERDPLRST